MTLVSRKVGSAVILEMEAAAVDPKMEQRAALLAKLAAIDADTDKPRTKRELILSRAATLTWLATRDAEAATLRAELEAL